ncbi:hypothetical protein MBANPS3_004499 [Mucor bainieri]
MPVKLPNLIPPFRFTMVEENLFRGGYPKPRNKRFLKRLRLKTILSLIPDKLMPEMQEFCEENNINLLHLTVDKMKEDNIPLTYNKTLMALQASKGQAVLIKILQLMIDPENHPLYIHCLDGADVTGLVIACLRKLQMWSISSALGEFVRNLHTSVISSEEFEFVENFKNFEVTIPMTLPLWLWGGQVNFRKHTSLRLKFLNPEMMTEEERELKDLKEKKEKEKEDYYKKRKNDLLDNLFDPNAAASGRHRSGSNIMNSHSGSNGTGGGASGNNGSSNVSLNANSSSINTMAPSTPGMNDIYAIASSSSLASESSTRHGRNETDHTKDPYLVDVDVDVDGVMMDGLDQVEYMNRANGGTSGSRFYGDGNDDVLLMDDEGDIYNGEQGARFITEPISRTLEALALEGLTEF